LFLYYQSFCILFGNTFLKGNGEIFFNPYPKKKEEKNSRIACLEDSNILIFK
jgi:hypothetical protein